MGCSESLNFCLVLWKRCMTTRYTMLQTGTTNSQSSNSQTSPGGLGDVHKYHLQIRKDGGHIIHARRSKQRYDAQLLYSTPVNIRLGWKPLKDIGPDDPEYNSEDVFEGHVRHWPDSPDSRVQNAYFWVLGSRRNYSSRLAYQDSAGC